MGNPQNIPQGEGGSELSLMPFFVRIGSAPGSERSQSKVKRGREGFSISWAMSVCSREGAVCGSSRKRCIRLERGQKVVPGGEGSQGFSVGQPEPVRRFLEHKSKEHQLLLERIPAAQVRSVALVHVYGNVSQFLVERASNVC